MRKPAKGTFPNVSDYSDYPNTNISNFFFFTKTQLPQWGRKKKRKDDYLITSFHTSKNSTDLNSYKVTYTNFYDIIHRVSAINRVLLIWWRTPDIKMTFVSKPSFYIVFHLNLATKFHLGSNIMQDLTHKSIVHAWHSHNCLNYIINRTVMSLVDILHPKKISTHKRVNAVRGWTSKIGGDWALQ